MSWSNAAHSRADAASSTAFEVSGFATRNEYPSGDLSRRDEWPPCSGARVLPGHETRTAGM